VVENPMRWKLAALLALTTVTAPLTAQAGQTQMMYQPFPETGTVLEVEVTRLFERANGYRYAELSVTRIFGEPILQVFHTSDHGVAIRDQKVSKGFKLETEAFDPAGFDPDGSPLVVMRTEGELDRSSLHVNQRYLYLHPGQFFEATPKRLAHVKKSRR
jgi:hypothetical protein